MFIFARFVESYFIINHVVPASPRMVLLRKIKARAKMKTNVEDGKSRESWHHVFEGWGEEDFCEEDA